MTYIFEHGKKRTEKLELEQFDTAALLTRRDAFAKRLKAAIFEGAEPADNTYFLAQRVFRAARALERLALEEDRKVSLMMERWNTAYSTPQ
jgi:hypothetical protein